MMLDQPDGILRAFGAVLRTAGAIPALMIRHQLEARRGIFGVGGELLFEPRYLGFFEIENAAQCLRISWAEHGRRQRRLLCRERRGCQRRQRCETDEHTHSVRLARYWIVR